MKGKYIVKTYESAQNTGKVVAAIEWWPPWPGTTSKEGDIEFGFSCLRDARKWASSRVKELRI